MCLNAGNVRKHQRIAFARVLPDESGDGLSNTCFSHNQRVVSASVIEAAVHLLVLRWVCTIREDIAAVSPTSSNF